VSSAAQHKPTLQRLSRVHDAHATLANHLLCYAVRYAPANDNTEKQRDNEMLANN